MLAKNMKVLDEAAAAEAHSQHLDRLEADNHIEDAVSASLIRRQACLNNRPHTGHNGAAATPPIAMACYTSRHSHFTRSSKRM